MPSSPRRQRPWSALRAPALLHKQGSSFVCSPLGNRGGQQRLRLARGEQADYLKDWRAAIRADTEATKRRQKLADAKRRWRQENEVSEARLRAKREEKALRERQAALIASSLEAWQPRRLLERPATALPIATYSLVSVAAPRPNSPLALRHRPTADGSRSEAARLLLSPVKAPAARLRYLEACRASKCLPFAGCIFAIEHGKTQEHVVMRHQELGPDHAAALATALRATDQTCNIRHLDLSSNNLGPVGVRKLCEVIAAGAPAALEALDLTTNAIGGRARSTSSQRECAAAVAGAMPRLTKLLLGGNALNEVFLQELGSALDRQHISDSGGPSVLDLSHNEICTPAAHDALTTLLSRHLRPFGLRELDLSWNKIGHSGGKELVSSLYGCRATLKSLRLSFCGLTDGVGAELGALLLSGSAELEELVLDNNYLSDTTAAAFAAALENSRVKTPRLRTLLLGFNPLGFNAAVRVVQAAHSAPSLQQLGVENVLGVADYERMRSDIVAKDAANRAARARRRSIVDAAKLASEKGETVGAAPSSRNASDPEGSIQDKPPVRAIAVMAEEDGPVQELWEEANVVSRARREAIRSAAARDGTSEVGGSAEGQLKIAVEFPPRIRRSRRVFVAPVAKAIERWSMRSSIFGPRRRGRHQCDSRDFYDSVTTIEQAHSAAFGHSKIARFVKEEQELESIKASLLSKASLLRAVFRFYASSYGTNDVFAMTLNGWTEFVQDSDLVDGSKCKLADVDRIFIACNVERKGGDATGVEDNNLRTLEHFEFLEGIVRLAKARFVESAELNSLVEAVQFTLNHHVEPHARCSNADRFRESRMYKEPVDVIFRSCEAPLRAVFSVFSGRTALPDRPRFMSFAEYSQLFAKLPQLRNDNLKVDDFAFFFALSKMAVCDDALRTEKEHWRYPKEELTFVDFLESLCRIAEEMCPDAAGAEDKKETQSANGLELKLPAVLSALLFTHGKRAQSPFTEFFANPPTWLLAPDHPDE